MASDRSVRNDARSPVRSVVVSIRGPASYPSELTVKEGGETRSKNQAAHGSLHQGIRLDDVTIRIYSVYLTS